MVTIQPKHLAAWSKANELTKPGKSEKPPTYGAHHRQRAERMVEREEPREVEGPTVQP